MAILQLLNNADNTSGSWATESVDLGTVGGYSSIIIDSLGYIHISFAGTTAVNKQLRYATNSSGSWATTLIDEGVTVGTKTSIAVDSGDKMHISYINSGDGSLKYATNVSGGWVVYTAYNGGTVTSNSITIDSNDVPYIVFTESGAGLKYATIQ
jgi:hypothetical protein